MATVPQLADSRKPGLLRGSLVFLAILVVIRFALELAGVPQTIARYLSSTAGLFLAAIFVGAVAYWRGVHRFSKLIVPAVVLSAWTTGWIVVATLAAALFRLERSHFAEPEDYGNWTHLGRHLAGHLIEFGVFTVIILILMAVPFFVRRWPITVAPAAVLGGLVIMRYTTEAVGVETWRAAAWSSTVGIVLCGLYLGGSARWFGLTSRRQLLVPSLILGWVWRFWAFLAALMSAALPFYKTHFFDPSQGRVAQRLLGLLGFGIVEGFLAGIVLVWTLALWILTATGGITVVTDATSLTAAAASNQRQTAGEPRRTDVA